MKKELTQEEIKSLLNYDPETGIITWRENRGPHKVKGLVAGWKHPTGYIVIKINHVGYKAHRLAWVYMTGKWPVKFIDHKNRDGFDNRWINLREATRSQNKNNSKTRKDSKLGIKGVYFTNTMKTRKFFAKIFINKKSEYLGWFETIEEAKAAYDEAAKKHFGDFFNPG